MLPSKIIIGKSPVSTNADGLISLTDLWKAAGGSKTKQPSNWLKQDGVAEFIRHVAEKANSSISRICVSKAGRYGGTYAHWQVALAFAKWLSPELHMAVNEVFLRYKAGDPTLAEEVIDKVEDPAALERIERRARNFLRLDSKRKRVVDTVTFCWHMRRKPTGGYREEVRHRSRSALVTHVFHFYIVCRLRL